MIARLLRSTGLAMSGLLALAGVVSAATVPTSLTTTGPGMTYTVNSVHLVTRAAVNVTISIVCDPLDEFGTPVSALVIDGNVITVTEAVGKKLAQGTAFVSGNVTCDSSTVNHLTVLVVSSTVPFKAGGAVIQTFAQAIDFNFCCTSDHAAVAGAIKIQR
jgi:hypothetical protein